MDAEGGQCKKSWEWAVASVWEERGTVEGMYVRGCIKLNCVKMVIHKMNIPVINWVALININVLDIIFLLKSKIVTPRVVQKSEPT